MDFISTRDFGSEAERVIWEAMKEAFFDSEPGFCWHRYPITSLRGPRIEPDLVILHPEWGLNIIEVKGCSISHIEVIEGYIWYMSSGWYKDEMEPYDQAQKHMWAIVDRLKEFKHGILRDEKGDCKVAYRSFVGLPFITEQEWRQRFKEHLSAPKWELIFSTDLQPESLRHRLINSPVRRQQQLTDEEWEVAVAAIRGSEGLQTRPRRPAKRKDSKAAWLRQVEQKMKSFDLEQHRVAVQIPGGPQRIRGLAGTGKTVVLAQKAAHMHVTYPGWDIVFTFYSRSLYGQVRKYINRFVQEFSNGELDEPNWDKLRIWHGWGGLQTNPGLYQQLCEAMDTPFRNYGNAQSYFATSGSAALDGCCAELLEEDVPQLFDAILVDEAQDFGTAYFRLCYAALKQPKRLIWGYDEIQSLEALEIPTAETLFGHDADGKPIVDLGGVYPGDIEKDLILYHCYRNPRPILIAAHALGLGLLRKGGAIQFIDTVAGWRDIGYEVEGVTDNKLTAGKRATLYRSPDNSPHILEQLAGYHNLVEWKIFESREAELEWIINNVAENIEEDELSPDEIAIIALESRKRIADSEYAKLHEGLTQRGVVSVRIGTDTKSDVFRREGAVTITSIFRAKGNEASLVYVYGFEDVGNQRDIIRVIRSRNRAFTAMTRAKGWLVLTGVGNVAKELFREVGAILEQPGRVTFLVPDMAKIQRNLETYENQRRRARIRQADKSLAQLIKDLTDVDPADLSSEQRKHLIRILLRGESD